MPEFDFTVPSFDFTPVKKHWRDICDWCAVRVDGLGDFAWGKWLTIGIVVALVTVFRRPILGFVVKSAYIVFWPFVKLWGLVRTSWREKDWFELCIWAVLGFLLVGLYKIAMLVIVADLFGVIRDTGRSSSIPIVLTVCAAVAVIYFYARALTAVKGGSLVVYRDWSDFLKSATWVIALPVGIGLAASADGEWLMACAGIVLVVLGIVSFYTMVRGAFRYNPGNGRWLSLFARVAVIVLLVCAISELHGRLDRHRRGELGIVRDVLLPLLVFAYVYKALVRPMIGSRY